MKQKGSVIFYWRDGMLYAVNGVRDANEDAYTDEELSLLAQELLNDIIANFEKVT